MALATPFPDRLPAMVLAAGRGERMRPLTDHTPKPLLPVRGKPLMLWPLDALRASGHRRFVVNTAWLGEQIPPLLESWAAQQQPSDDGTPIDLKFSHEEQDFGYALETAGGIARALPLLDSEAFWVLAGDVFAPDFDFATPSVQRFLAGDRLAHLWLVPNPPHNAKGDFGLSPDGRALNIDAAQGEPRWTFSTIALYRPELFLAPWCDILPGNPQGTAAPLAPLLRHAMDAGRVSAEIYTGGWTDVGTPERLAALST